jgi:hypothetical protein
MKLAAEPKHATAGVVVGQSLAAGCVEEKASFWLLLRTL